MKNALWTKSRKSPSNLIHARVGELVDFEITNLLLEYLFRILEILYLKLFSVDVGCP